MVSTYARSVAGASLAALTSPSRPVRVHWTGWSPMSTTPREAHRHPPRSQAFFAGSLALLLVGCGGTVAASTSRADIPSPLALTVRVEPGRILVDDEVVSTLASPDDGADGQLVAVLKGRMDTLRAAAAKTGEAPPRRFGVSASPDASALTVASVLEAARPLGLDKPWLLVRGPEGDSGIAVAAPTPTAKVATSSPSAAKPRSTEDITGYANPVVTLDPERGYVVSVRDEVFDPGRAGLELPCPTRGCAAWPTAELNRLARRVRIDHPTDRAVAIVPTPGITVQDVVHALDATRDDAPTARGERELLPEAILLSAAP